jgi:hypothetical protein
MKKGRLALVNGPEFDYCTSYHCAGDCGHPHNSAERAKYVRHAMSVFDALERPEKENRRLAAESVRVKAKELL